MIKGKTVGTLLRRDAHKRQLIKNNSPPPQPPKKVCIHIVLFCYRQFQDSLPKSSAHVYWIPARNYETGVTINYRATT